MNLLRLCQGVWLWRCGQGQRFIKIYTDYEEVIDPMTEIIYAIVDIPQNENPIGAKGKAKE